MKKFIVVVALLFAVAFAVFGLSFDESIFSDVTFETVLPSNERNTVDGLSYMIPAVEWGMSLNFWIANSLSNPETKNLVLYNTPNIIGTIRGFAVRLKYPCEVFQAYVIRNALEVPGGAQPL